MGPFQKLLRSVLVPGEPAVERMRKEFVVPLYCGLGSMMAVWSMFIVVLPSEPLSSAILETTASAVCCIALLSAAARIIRTKRVPQVICEWPVLVCAAMVIVYDVSAVIRATASLVSLNVLSLDALLLCNCSDAATRAAVRMTAVWICVRACLEWVNLRGDDCFDGPPFLSLLYFGSVAGSILFRMSVLLVDYKLTRGFAKSMNQQKSLVEASIQVSERAAILLSRYETEDTRMLLEGPDGDRLPPGLLSALLQLVANLAEYRPYLPQTCLPGEALDTELEERSVNGSQRSAFSIGRESVHSAKSSQQAGGDRAAPQVVVATEAKQRRVSLLAANSRSFLAAAREKVATVRSLLHFEVDLFVGEVARERGVVDLVSGDHALAHFNGSRLCTTHRVGAARASSPLAGFDSSRVMTRSDRRRATGRRAPLRTASVCSGSILCGDFGTADVRRFMLLGPTFNTLQCLERVAAQLGDVLVDDVVGEDADVQSNFFTQLVEQVCYPKRGPKPFLVWRLAGRRETSDQPDEWMYELERQAPNPFADWNATLLQWLDSAPDEQQLRSAPSDVLTRRRQQSWLTEATIVGPTVALGARPADTMTASGSSSMQRSCSRSLAQSDDTCPVTSIQV